MAIYVPKAWGVKLEDVNPGAAWKDWRSISCWCVSYQCQKQSHTAIQIDILRGFCGPARKAKKKKEFVAVCHERAKSKVPSLRQVNSKPVWIRTSLNQSYKGLTACNFNPKPNVYPGVTAGCSLSPPGYGYRPNKVYGARGACFAMWSCTSRRPLRKTIFAAGLTGSKESGFVLQPKTHAFLGASWLENEQGRPICSIFLY